MEKTILMMLLVVASSSAAAEWVRIDESAVSTYYADPSTIRKNGNTVKMWDLTDLKIAEKLPGIPGDKATASYKQQVEYDCKQNLTRNLAGSAYSEKMTRGESLFAYDKPQEWEPVETGTIKHKFLDLACRK